MEDIPWVRSQTIKRDLELNDLSLDMIHGRALWHSLIHVADTT